MGGPHKAEAVIIGAAGSKSLFNFIFAALKIKSPGRRQNRESAGADEEKKVLSHRPFAAEHCAQNRDICAIVILCV
jgi:hypothetical protein